MGDADISSESRPSLYREGREAHKKVTRISHVINSQGPSSRPVSANQLLGSRRLFGGAACKLFRELWWSGAVRCYSCPHRCNSSGVTAGAQSPVNRCLFPKKCHAIPCGHTMRTERDICELSTGLWDWCGGRASASLSLSPLVFILGSSVA